MAGHHGGWRRSRVLLAAGVAAAAVVGAASIGVSPAQADIACGAHTVKQPFIGWGDSNKYFIAANGGFEGGSANWLFSGGASVVSENEPWRINGSTHTKSVRIPSGASVVTEKFCVNSDEDSLRFFAKRPGVGGAGMQVFVRVTSGANVATNEITLDGSQAGWTLSDRMMLPDIRDASGQQWVQITFTPRNVAATWNVDDVMIDPWRTR